MACLSRKTYDIENETYYVTSDGVEHREVDLSIKDIPEDILNKNGYLFRTKVEIGTGNLEQFISINNYPQNLRLSKINLVDISDYLYVLEEDYGIVMNGILATLTINGGEYTLDDTLISDEEINISRVFNMMSNYSHHTTYTRDFFIPNPTYTNYDVDYSDKTEIFDYYQIFLTPSLNQTHRVSGQNFLLKNEAYHDIHSVLNKLKLFIEKKYPRYKVSHTINSISKSTGSNPPLISITIIRDVEYFGVLVTDKIKARPGEMFANKFRVNIPDYTHTYLGATGSSYGIDPVVDIWNVGRAPDIGIVHTPIENRVDLDTEREGIISRIRNLFR